MVHWPSSAGEAAGAGLASGEPRLGCAIKEGASNREAHATTAGPALFAHAPLPDPLRMFIALTGYGNLVKFRTLSLIVSRAGLFHWVAVRARKVGLYSRWSSLENALRFSSSFQLLRASSAVLLISTRSPTFMIHEQGIE